MKKYPIMILIIWVAGLAVADDHSPPLLSKLSHAEILGEAFKRSDMIETRHDDGHVTLDVTMMTSSDEQFSTGMYRSGKTRLEINQPYGVDEFMYFVEGSVTLTETDGTVQTIRAGEAVTIAKEWTGIWETEGYTKIWVIYAQDAQ
ncbi:MAG: cupin domain-containing protein [Pseudomonadales bacterium]|jgi:uncharacterized cupin superfamily protein|nr:cupin domain-containing protein [Pseudomonadota bacterium]MDA0956853.1 cupin domain-containing protein [Pseudomonadota bacterium]